MESLEELLARATPLPWEHSPRYGGATVRARGSLVDAVCTMQVASIPEWRENADLIVRAVNALPATRALLDAARKHRAAEVETHGDDWTLRDAIYELEDVLEGGAVPAP